MDQREEKVVYGCFHCGTKVEAPDDLIRPALCEDCGWPHLLTHQEALDILNDLYLKKKFKPYCITEDDEGFIVDNYNEE